MRNLRMGIMLSAVLLATVGLLACGTDPRGKSTGLYAAMPNGEPFNGIDPVTGVTASLGDIETCYKLGGVVEQSYHGGAMSPPKKAARCTKDEVAKSDAVRQ